MPYMKPKNNKPRRIVIEEVEDLTGTLIGSRASRSEDVVVIPLTEYKELLCIAATHEIVERFARNKENQYRIWDMLPTLMGFERTVEKGDGED